MKSKAMALAILLLARFAVAQIASCAQPCIENAATTNTTCGTALACMCEPHNAAIIQDEASTCVVTNCGLDIALNVLIQVSAQCAAITRVAPSLSVPETPYMTSSTIVMSAASFSSIPEISSSVLETTPIFSTITISVEDAPSPALEIISVLSIHSSNVAGSSASSYFSLTETTQFPSTTSSAGVYISAAASSSMSAFPPKSSTDPSIIEASSTAAVTDTGNTTSSSPHTTSVTPASALSFTLGTAYGTGTAATTSLVPFLGAASRAAVGQGIVVFGIVAVLAAL